jgi:hypothetical protein
VKVWKFSTPSCLFADNPALPANPNVSCRRPSPTGTYAVSIPTAVPEASAAPAGEVAAAMSSVAGEVVATMTSMSYTAYTAYTASMSSMATAMSAAPMSTAMSPSAVSSMSAAAGLRRHIRRGHHQTGRSDSREAINSSQGAKGQ